jgi:hypothetical protein
MISRTGAGNVQKVSLSIVDILQIGVVTNGLDTFLQRNDFIIASHHCHGAKFQTFGEVHCELLIWPPPRPAFQPFGPPPGIDISTTSEWGRIASERRRAVDLKVDQELAEAEAAKKEFYRGH